MYEFLRDLDRRWIFALMFLAVLLPILFGTSFPEEPGPMSKDVFKAMEDLPEGSRILMAFDYDPGSEGELAPMAYAFTRQCAERKLKMYFMALWPLGVPMIQQNMELLKSEYPDLEYGTDYVSLGFKPGNEGVIKVVVTDLRQLFPTDQKGTSLDNIPLTTNIKNIQEMDMIVSVSAGDPGTKQWVQYACTPYDIPIVGGCTGVQAPQLYPYIPNQLIGILAAIKGAAEYEFLLLEKYDHFKENGRTSMGLQRMGPQLVAHLLIILLIVMANIIYFVGKSRGEM